MKKLYVGNLAYSVTDQELNDLFLTFGEVASVNIIKDRETGRAKGFAFVEMSDETNAAEAIKKLHGEEHFGRSLIVNEARDKKDFNRR